MTYCLGIALDDGLVCVADSRTNAGVDNVSTFGKLRVFARDGERVIAVMSAGNLSITQGVLSLLEQRHLHDPDASSLWSADSMYEAARLVGEAMREIQDRDAEPMRRNNIEPAASFIVGGQIGEERIRLFMVYAEGNFIEAGADTNYFQIGENKYGKPMLDRILSPSVTLADATKCALLSFDATMRSNISVGAPLDLLLYRAGSLSCEGPARLQETDPYFQRLRQGWSDGLSELFDRLPPPDWA